MALGTNELGYAVAKSGSPTTNSTHAIFSFSSTVYADPAITNNVINKTPTTNEVKIAELTKKLKDLESKNAILEKQNTQNTSQNANGPFQRQFFQRSWYKF